MTQTDTTSTEMAAFDWIAAAETERQNTIDLRRAHNQGVADTLNAKLAEWGITPARPACTSSDGYWTLALVVEADAENERYAVHAAWDEDEGEVLLKVADYDSDGFSGLRDFGPLHNLGDISRARHEGPQQRPETRSTARHIAEVSLVKTGPFAHQSSVDARAIVEALRTLTGAVLALGEKFD